MISVYKTRMQRNVNDTREGKPANFRQLSTSFHFMLSYCSVKFTQSTVFSSDSRLESVEVEESQSHRIVDRIERSNERCAIKIVRAHAAKF